jgi:nitroreductase
MTDTMVDSRIIRDAVQLACRAPSLHNSQPWRLEVDDEGLQLFLDRTRVVQSTDRSGREAVISCGALLHHLRVAMEAAGWSSTVDRFPNPNNHDHLATVTFAPMDFVTDAHRRRADAILSRRTDRLPMTAPPDWDAVESLVRAGLDEGVYLDVLAEDARPQLGDASQLAEALRLYDSTYHAELNWWTAPFEVTDGIPHSSLISAAESERVEVNRAFPMTRHGERRPAIADDRATILVLSTDADSPDDALRCGEAMSDILLECTTAGLATCTVTHVTEIPAAREVVAAQTGRAALPQLLIRVGLAPALEELPPPTPRRPLEDVLRFC